MNTPAIKVARLADALYSVEAATPTASHYEVERFPCGSWMLFLICGEGRDFLYDAATKRGALALALAHAVGVQATRDKLAAPKAGL